MKKPITLKVYNKRQILTLKSTYKNKKTILEYVPKYLEKDNF